MKINLRKAAAAVRNHKLMAMGTGLAMSVPAFAQTGDSIDVSTVVAIVTSGLAAIATLGAAFVGFKYLKKVWNRI